MKPTAEQIKAIALIVDGEAWKAIEDGRDALPGSLWGFRRDIAMEKAMVIAALPSSPGKDGGQEVDLRRPLQMCVDMLKSNGFGVASVVEVAERALAASSESPDCCDGEDCQYAKAVSMPEYRCVGKCQYSGRDGGQEVEAVAVLGYVREAGLRSLAERNHTSVYPLPDEERGYTIPVYTQPASTALVERLKERGQAFANQVRLITHLLHGQAYSTTVAELNAFDSALSASQSTSREGESRG